MALSYKVIENQDGLKELAGRLSCEDSFALDIEADSLHNYEGKVCLIQISTREENYIIDVLKLPDLEPLRPVLFDDRIEKVLHGADYDIRMLAKDYGMEIRNLFDTMIAGQILGLKGLGLAALLNDYFKVNIDKGLQKADWSRRPLSKEMLSYAALDTAHLLSLRALLAAFQGAWKRSSHRHCKGPSIHSGRPKKYSRGYGKGCRKVWQISSGGDKKGKQCPF